MLPPLRPAVLGLILLGLSAPPARWAGAPCPPATGPLLDRAWAAYHADSTARAAELFAAARRACPDHLDAIIGLGYALLRLGRTNEAAPLFRTAVARDSTNADGWEGLALVESRRGHHEAAVADARRLLKLDRASETATRILDQQTPGWRRGPPPQRVRPQALELPARTHGDRFEIAGARGWQPFYVQGVNLGVALPGRFPGEFPSDSGLYAGWLASIAGMNANTVRVYTILDPAFYRALRAWNLSHSGHELWLVHGVWAELPPRDDFDDPRWKEEFRLEMRRVVDVIHGACQLPVRPGHAAGRFDADVSSWTLATIIGREWEPFALQHFESAGPAPAGFHGRFLEAPTGTRSEIWMAEQCDHLLSHEFDRFHALHPIAFTNWPTLDPLHHPTESSVGEERVWRRRVGRPALRRKLEYDNDTVSLDANAVRPTAANPAGWFASYHAYPYYPDFMLVDPGYGRAASSEGRSSYFGYLSDLKRHHAGIPMLIAEYGVPSSRGVAHLQPQGWDHGGHDERQMAEIDARLTREIRESGAAGSIVFEWIDEWFKKNWVVVDLEIPLENTRRWHNAMDAEQNYGILGMVAGSASRPEPGGDPARWLALEPLATAPGGARWSPRTLRAGCDASFVYLAVELEGAGDGGVPWDSVRVAIALDTVDPSRGQRRIRGLVERSEVGFEFLADLRGPEASALLVTPDYNPYAALASGPLRDDRGAFYHRPIVTRARDDGRFDSLLVIVNRMRFGRDGTEFPARESNRGRLRSGPARESSLSDWAYDPATRLVELRLPWGLLNVSDPSSRRVLLDAAPGDEFGSVESDSFRIGVVTYRRLGTAGVLGALPRLVAGGRWARAGFPTWTWAPWTEPAYHTAMKPVYEALRQVWRDSSDANALVAQPGGTPR